MLNKFAVACGALVASSFCSTVQAQKAEPFLPTERVALSQREISGRASDIVGIKTGMTGAEAEAALKQYWTAQPVNRIMKTLGGSIKGIPVSTVPYPGMISAETMAGSPNYETITVTLTSPASGNRVVSVARNIAYRDTLSSPELEAMKSNVLNKYGVPSETSENSSSIDMNYYYRSGKQIACDQFRANGSSCYSFAANAFQPELADEYLRAIQGGRDDFMIAISIRKDLRSNRASGMSSSLSDWTIRGQGAKADMEALIENADKRQAAAPQVAAPRL